jgi:hypothetical protein
MDPQQGREISLINSLNYSVKIMKKKRECKKDVEYIVYLLFCKVRLN